MIKSIDVIIPVYKPGDKFLRLLSMLDIQTVPYSKLIIINTVPDAEAAAILGRGKPKNACEAPYDKSLFRYSGALKGSAQGLKTEAMVRDTVKDAGKVIIKHIPQSLFDHAGTRKAAVTLSDADAFLCMTDDAVPCDGRLIENLILALNSAEKIAIAYARQIAGSDEREREKYTREFNYPTLSRVKSIKDIDKLGIKTYFASNACCAYNRAIYDSLGGFVANAIFNEDMVYAAKALNNGCLSCYKAEAAVVHSHRYTPMAQLRRNFDLGVSQAMHPEVFAGIRSEGEGLRLVRSTALKLIKSRHISELPGLVIDSGFKYIGYRLGKSYRALPACMIPRLAMNKTAARRIVMSFKKN